MALKSSQRIIGTGKKTVPQEQQSVKAPILNEAIKVRNHLFVISINDYKFCPPLFNAVKDAEDVIRVLTNLYDFDAQNVVKLSNAQATESNIVAQLKAYVSKLSVKDNLLVYYSGHGTYDAIIEEGYWVPVDVDFRATTGDIDPSRCLANGMILKYLNAIKSLHTIVIADACFSGSLATQRLVSTGASRLETIPSRCILTAGRNEPVLDGKPGDNSPFASALIRYLEKNTEEGVSFTDLGSFVQKAVANNSKQIPICARLQNAGDQNGEFVFHRKQDENTFWAHILRMNAVEGYKGYMVKYPQGLYVKEANAALARLQKPVKPKANEMAVKQGTILYDVPSKMQLLQEVKCVVRIAFDEVMAKLDFKMTPDTELKTMRVSNVMNVEVFDESQQAFAIRTISASRQFIDSDYFTQWLFYVKPLKEGNYTLLLKVTVVEKVGKEELLREIVLEETVSIVANLPQPEPSRMRAVSEKLILAPSNAKLPVVTPPNTPISPKTTTTNTGGMPMTNEIGVRVAHIEMPNTVPVPPPAPQPLARVGNPKWMIGGGTLAVLLAIFMVGKNSWNSSSSSPSKEAGVFADNHRSALPTTPLPASTPTLLSKDTAFTPIVRPTEAAKIVQPVKRPAPVFAEAKPKQNTSSETFHKSAAIKGTTSTALKKEPEMALMGDIDEQPSAARWTFREPSENVKAVSKVDEEAWRKAKMNGEALAYKKYMEEQPNGAYRPFAKERWEGLREMDDWHQVENTPSWDGYQKHLAKYPQGRFLKKAMERKNALEARKKEPR
ncbi:MAG: hypothetical protein RL329_2535 [Bacteroidota bacterium]